MQCKWVIPLTADVINARLQELLRDGKKAGAPQRKREPADIDKAATLPPYAAVVGSPAATNQWGLKGNTVRRTH